MQWCENDCAAPRDLLILPEGMNHLAAHQSAPYELDATGSSIGDDSENLYNGSSFQPSSPKFETYYTIDPPQEPYAWGQSYLFEQAFKETQGQAMSDELPAFATQTPGNIAHGVGTTHSVEDSVSLPDSGSGIGAPIYYAEGGPFPRADQGEDTVPLELNFDDGTTSKLSHIPDAKSVPPAELYSAGYQTEAAAYGNSALPPSNNYNTLAIDPFVHITYVNSVSGPVGTPQNRISAGCQQGGSSCSRSKRKRRETFLSNSLLNSNKTFISPKEQLAQLQTKIREPKQKKKVVSFKETEPMTDKGRTEKLRRKRRDNKVSGKEDLQQLVSL
jgi:hypothetical protein